MAFSTSTTKPAQETVPATQKPTNDVAAASLLSALLLAVYAGAKSRKQLRRLKRQTTWLLVKQKARSLFSRNAASERQTIIYILLGIAVLALIFASPVAALVLAIIGLILILTGTI
jgi:Mg2+/citrate symporter